MGFEAGQSPRPGRLLVGYRTLPLTSKSLAVFGRLSAWGLPCLVLGPAPHQACP